MDETVISGSDVFPTANGGAARIPGARGPAKLLVVDDDERNRKYLHALLRAEGYITVEAANGHDALEQARLEQPAVVLLDVMMPGMDGYEVARQMKADPATSTIPIVMVTALADRDSRLRGLGAGAEEFVSKPVDSLELRVRVRNLLRLKEYSDFLADHNRILDAQVRERTRQLQDSYREIIFTMTAAAEYKDEDTGAHVQRISYYTALLAQTLGLGDEFTDLMFYASPMHDIGKIGIPDRILLKPGKFTPEEWTIMQTHAALGAKMLAQGSTPYVKAGAEIALAHHERWDGSGYPNGLKGEAIPLSGRIMNICDQYDALRSQRPYKPPFPHEKTIEIITRGDGRTQPGHFDPAVLEAFGKCTDGFAEIFSTHAD
ncbi:MAG: two-component system response regulator [Candidatus Rokuibacteriota bacterium]